MSSVYTLGPQTSGKIILVTNYGNIDIELWTKEVPRACRNFIQLCMEGYYDKCFFFRIIKGFMIQTGDPTNTGSGGESIWGKEFQDEFHSRLKFNQRGIVAMANRNLPNTNTSQFFITLDKCSWLNNKHTIFGRVVGDTFFNAMAIGDLPTKEEFPMTDTIPMIIRTEVVLNPFLDIVPRTKLPKKEKKEDSQAIEKSLTKFKNAEKMKNTQLLSFDDGEEEENAFTKRDDRNTFKIKPIHEIVKNDRKLVNVPVPVPSTQEQNEKLSHIKDKIKKINKKEEKEIAKPVELSESSSESESEDDKMDLNLQEELEQNLDSERKTEILQLKKDIIKIKKRIDNPNAKEEENEEEQRPQSVLKRHLSQFLHLKKGRTNTKSTIDYMNKFREKLKSNKTNTDNWMSNKLKFHVDSQKAYAINESRERQMKSFGYDPGMK